MIKLKLFIYIAVMILVSYYDINAQTKNIGFGTSTPDPSALLDLNVNDNTLFPTKLGFLAPRMTMADRDLINSPAVGLIIYQTDSNPGFYYYTGTAWVRLVENVYNGFLPVSGGTMTGNIDLNNNLLLNIGNANTDFTSSGGLNLNDALNVANGGITINGNSSFSGNITLNALNANSVVKTDASKNLTSGTINLNSDISGTLGIANGGTSITTVPLNGQILIGNGTGYSLANLTAGSNINISNGSGNITISATSLGTVSSVGLSLPTEFNVANSPVTSTGTINATWNSQTAHTILAAPSTNGTPSFRLLAVDDIPSLSTDKLTSGILPVSHGGSGVDNLTGMLKGNGSDAYTALTNTAGNVTFWNTNSEIGGADSLFWDTATRTLKIGGNLNVSGNIDPLSIQMIPLNSSPQNPQKGTFYYDNTDNSVKIYNGSVWDNINGAAASWTLTGSSGTNPANNYIGTSDDIDLILKTNNVERIKLNSSTNGGNVKLTGNTENTGNLLLTNTANASELRLYEPNASGTQYSAIKAQAQAANITYTLPATSGTNGQVLTTDNTGNLSWATPAALPSGVIIPYAGSAAPSGWLICNGAEYNRTDYAALFAIIGTTYGAGNGTTTFNVPDLRGRFPLGLDNMGGTAANRVKASAASNLGQGAGIETKALSVAEMPAHSHDVNVDAMVRRNNSVNPTGMILGNGSIDIYSSAAVSSTKMRSDAIASNGSSTAFSIMNPYISLNYIIKY